jgi:hypothetical protein
MDGFLSQYRHDFLLPDVCPVAVIWICWFLTLEGGFHECAKKS